GAGGQQQVEEESSDGLHCRHGGSCSLEKKLIGNRRQIIEYQGSRWQWLGQGPLTLTGFYQYGLAMDGQCGVEVTGAVADEPGACQFCAVVRGDLLEHSRLRLAAAAAVIRAVWAVHDQADFAALLGHQLSQTRMHGLEGGSVVVAARQARLVGGHG